MTRIGSCSAEPVNRPTTTATAAAAAAVIIALNGFLLRRTLG